MPIYDLTYRGWRGARTGTPAWFPVLENTVRLAFRNRLLFWLYLACALPPLVACVILYVRYSMEAAGFMSGRGHARAPRGVEFDLAQYFQFLAFQGGLAVVIAAVVGSQSIAGDRKLNALESIFARAITRREYLLGRFLGVFVLVLGATLIPGISIWICDNTFSLDPERLPLTLSYPARIAAWALILSSSASLLILAFSAMIRRGWLSIAAFVAFLILSAGVTAATAEALPRDAREVGDFIRGFGYFPALEAIQREIFGLTTKEARNSVSAASGILTIVLLALLSWATVLRRVKPIEVVS